MKAAQPAPVAYSVVLPVHNEAAGISSFVSSLAEVLESLGEPYEIIAVDDGSTDSSWEILCRLADRLPAVRAVSFSRNFGHQVAVAAGLRETRGRVVAVMDSDGQDPAALLPAMFRRLAEGYDVVYGVRRSRKEGLLKRVAYSVFYRLIQRMVPFHLPVDSGDFCVMGRPVADFLLSSLKHNPYIRGLRSWYGGRQTGFEYDRPARGLGQTSYTLPHLLNLALNGITDFSRMPLRLASLTGLLLALGGILFAFYALVMFLTVGRSPTGYTSMVALTTLLGGIQLIFLGVIAEYIGNIFDDVKDRPLYIVRQRRGIRR